MRARQLPFSSACMPSHYDLATPVVSSIAVDGHNDLAALQLMATMIEDADDVSQTLLDTILEHVVAPKKTEHPEAYKLASRLTADSACPGV